MAYLDYFNPGSAAMQGVGGALSYLQQGEAQRAYNAQSDQQMADMLGIASMYGPATMNAYDQSAGQQLGTIQDMQQVGRRGAQDLYGSTRANRGQFLADLDQRGGQLMQGYRDRYNTAAQDIEGYGTQMRADVNRGAAENRARFALNPLSRGSTISSSVNRNIEEGRTAEQRRLGEDLTRQRVNLLSGLSGDTLAAQGGLDSARAQYDSALRGQLLDTQRYGNEQNLNFMGNEANFYGNNASNRSALASGGVGTYLNTLGGMNLVPPQSNAGLMNQFGQNSVQDVQAPSFWSSAGPGIASGAMTGAGLVVGASIIATAVVCIDGESMLESLDGPIALKDVKVGMAVMNAEGHWRSVIAKHHRAYDGDDTNYITMSIGDRQPITLTRDHPVEGRPAGEWISDGIAWEKAIPESAGDIRLEDGSEYVANGYAITSLISDYDVPILGILEPENQLVSVE